MTDKTDTGERAVGNVVAREATAPGVSSDPRYPNMRATVTVGWSYSGFIDDDTMPTLISRDEVLDRLGQENAEVTERTLRSWEASGMLPRPLRKGGKDGARSSARALYPNWAVAVVAIARMIRGSGVSPSQTRGELQRCIPQIVASHNQGVRYGVVSYHLGRVLNDIVGIYPWPKGSTPAVMEVRILGTDGEEIHSQRISIPDGETIDEPCP